MIRFEMHIYIKKKKNVLFRKYISILNKYKIIINYDLNDFMIKIF